jgi:arylsulfatase
VPAQAVLAKWLDSFKEFPIRQKAGQLQSRDVMRKLQPSRAQD